MTVITMKKAPVSMRSRMETLLIGRAELDKWSPAPFQRPLRVNDKVRCLAESIGRDGGVIPGILTLGTVGQCPDLYVIDGQHRIEAARLSELLEFIVDVRVCGFDTLSDMGEEFVNLNSHLVSMRPDDMLRGLEGSIPILGVIRKNCGFVAYDNVRRNSRNLDRPMLSMSVALRCWNAAHQETPSQRAASAVVLARSTDLGSANELCQFLNTVRGAWGSDLEYARLWGSLNLTLTMWLWLETVLNTKHSVTRHTKMNVSQFGKGMMTLSADSMYLDWLTGRLLTDRDRAPCYNRIKKAISDHVKIDDKAIKFPAPAWAQ